jgi:hypothetical protein
MAADLNNAADFFTLPYDGRNTPDKSPAQAQVLRRRAAARPTLGETMTTMQDLPDLSDASAPITRLDRQARVVLGITEVLATRPDLRGVLGTADLLDEHVRWCA